MHRDLFKKILPQTPALSREGKNREVVFPILEWRILVRDEFPVRASAACAVGTDAAESLDELLS